MTCDITQSITGCCNKAVTAEDYEAIPLPDNVLTCLVYVPLGAVIVPGKCVKGLDKLRGCQITTDPLAVGKPGVPLMLAHPSATNQSGSEALADMYNCLGGRPPKNQVYGQVRYDCCYAACMHFIPSCFPPEVQKHVNANLMCESICAPIKSVQ